MNLIELHVLQCCDPPYDCVPSATEDEVRGAITSLLATGCIESTDDGDEEAATYRTTKSGKDVLATRRT
jgi:hypothetical protein